MKRMVSLALVLLGFGCATAQSGSSADEWARKVDPYALRKQLARSLIEHHEWSSAVRPLLELRAMRPKDAEVHSLLGTAYREQSLVDEAVGEYETALRLEPRLADAHAGLAMAHVLRGGSPDRAIGELKRAIELNPEDASYYNNLGFTLFLQGKYTEAVVAYRDGLRRAPEAHRMRNNLGFAYGRLGHLNRARREFERAGSAAEVQNNLGYVLEKNGDHAAACECYGEAKRLAPDWKTASANFTRACAEEDAMTTRSTP